MRKVWVELQVQRRYPIWVGEGALEHALRSRAEPRRAIRGARGAVRGTPRRRQAFVIADARLGRAAIARVAEAFERAGFEVATLKLKVTEELKDLARLSELYRWLSERKADRHSTLVALGGGVIGDAVGFVAATYMRGIAWIGIPTTLLAQVDSAIGGKTAVNLPHAKNLVGAFHQPAHVICDPGFLRTLPPRERVSGLGEIVKYALIYDAQFFAWLDRHWDALLAGEPGALVEAVTRSARFKARAVAADEYDRSGVREVLNFGHTVAHALEASTGYGYYRHGEAVAIGMRAALRISRARGHLSETEFARADELLARLPVPPIPPGVRPRTVLSKLRYDKKAVQGRVRFVLLASIGKTVPNARAHRAADRAVDSTVDASTVGEAIRFIWARSPRRGTPK